jgi:hypothetical protein
MEINLTLYGQCAFILILITTITLIYLGEYKNNKLTVFINFILNFLQPIGIMYFIYRIIVRKKTEI